MTVDGKRWLVLSVEAPPARESLLLVDALRRRGARIVDREEGRVVAWVPEPRDLEAFLASMRATIRASTSLERPDLSWRWDGGEGWRRRWARDVRARRVSEGLWIAPAGAGHAPDPVDPPATPRPPVRGPSPRPIAPSRAPAPGRSGLDAAPAPAGPAASGGPVVVRLVPGLAFGTAEHATTRCALRLLERWLRPGSRLADVGTGSGVLAVAAALLGAARVVAVDVDPLAVRAARANAVLNGVAGRVRVRTVRPEEPLGGRGLGFHGVVANIETGTLLPLVPGLARRVAPGGWLLLSGASLAEREGVVTAAVAAGLVPADEEAEEGWWAGLLAGRGGRRPQTPRPDRP